MALIIEGLLHCSHSIQRYCMFTLLLDHMYQADYLLDCLALQRY